MEFLNLSQTSSNLNISKVAVQKRVDSNNLVGFKVNSHKNYKYYIPEELLKFNPNKYSNKCKVFTVNNLKGGVGKTTVAISLSTVLGVMGKKVLLVDFDPQANSSTSFFDSDDVESMNSIKELIDIYIDKKSPTIEQIKESIKSFEYNDNKIDILTAKISLAKSIEQLRVSSHSTVFKLDSILKKIKDEYDYIIIDTPPNASIIMQMALYASDEIIAVTIPEQFSVSSMLELFTEIKNVNFEIEEYRGFGIDMFGVVVNNIQNTRVHKAQFDNIQEIAKQENIDAVYEIPKNIKVAEAQDLKIPLCIYKDELDSFGKSLNGIVEIAYDIITQE